MKTFIKILHRDPYATYYLCGDENKNYEVVKEIYISPDLSDKQKKKIKNDIRIISKLSHKNILDYHNVEYKPDVIEITMDYFPPPSTLKDMLQIKTKFHSRQIEFFLENIARGLAYLHKNKIAHRNLTPEAIFIAPRELSWLKIGRMGYATDEEGDITLTTMESPHFLAPELVYAEKGRKVDYFAADIWSFGCILFTMLTLEYPETRYTVRSSRNQLPESFDIEEWTNFVSLYVHCTEPDPIKRPNANELEEVCSVIQVAKPSWPIPENIKVYRNWNIEWVLPLGCERFPFTFFCDYFEKEYHADKADLYALKHILSVDGYIEVELLETWLKWVNPLGPHEGWTISQFRSLIEKPWFFKDYDAIESRRALSGQYNGTFLVRRSKEFYGWYVIQVVENNEITSKNIIGHPRHKEVEYNKKYYDDIITLVESHRSRWKYPCIDCSLFTKIPKKHLTYKDNRYVWQNTIPCSVKEADGNRLQQCMQVLEKLRHPNLASVYGFTNFNPGEYMIVYQVNLSVDKITNLREIFFHLVKGFCYLKSMEILYLDFTCDSIIYDHNIACIGPSLNMTCGPTHYPMHNDYPISEMPPEAFDPKERPFYAPKGVQLKGKCTFKTDVYMLGKAMKKLGCDLSICDSLIKRDPEDRPDMDIVFKHLNILLE